MDFDRVAINDRGNASKPVGIGCLCLGVNLRRACYQKGRNQNGSWESKSIRHSLRLGYSTFFPQDGIRPPDGGGEHLTFRFRIWQHEFVLEVQRWEVGTTTRAEHLPLPPPIWVWVVICLIAGGAAALILFAPG